MQFIRNNSDGSQSLRHNFFFPSKRECVNFLLYCKSILSITNNYGFNSSRVVLAWAAVHIPRYVGSITSISRKRATLIDCAASIERTRDLKTSIARAEIEVRSRNISQIHSDKWNVGAKIGAWSRGFSKEPLGGLSRVRTANLLWPYLLLSQDGDASIT